MKKANKFTTYGVIGTLAIPSIPASALNSEPDSERIFGKPRSILSESENGHLTPRLKIELRNSHLPQAVWADIEKLDQIWSQINSLSDYQNYAKSFNFHSMKDEDLSQTYEHQLLTALADPYLEQLVATENFEQLYLELIDRGLLNPEAEAKLAQNISRALEGNQSLRKEIQSTISKQLTKDITQSDYAYLLNTVKSQSNEQVVAAVPVLVVAAAAVAGAVVVIAAAGAYVVTKAAFSVSGGDGGVTNATARGGHGGGGMCTLCHQASRASHISSQTVKENHLVLSDVSSYFNSPVLAHQSFIKMKQSESKAAIDAALNLGLITIPDGEYDQVMAAMNRIIQKQYEVLQ
ncbi:hypothetical protein P0Y67_18375 [Photobacterium sp. SP02]|uniref:hypothetical protein n=1 Tax=Photobacterium sp. SP02 TaxID=3032280 RepID=UPI0031451C6F